jgi:hypothetical protein
MSFVDDPAADLAPWQQTMVRCAVQPLVCVCTLPLARSLTRPLVCVAQISLYFSASVVSVIFNTYLLAGTLVGSGGTARAAQRHFVDQSVGGGLVRRRVAWYVRCLCSASALPLLCLCSALLFVVTHSPPDLIPYRADFRSLCVIRVCVCVSQV